MLKGGRVESRRRGEEEEEISNHKIEEKQLKRMLKLMGKK
jgi:hypothetical protein